MIPWSEIALTCEQSHPQQVGSAMAAWPSGDQETSAACTGGSSRVVFFGSLGFLN